MRRASPVYALLLLPLLLPAPAASAAAWGVEEWAVGGGVFDVANEGRPAEAGAEVRFTAFELPLFSRRFAIEPGLGATVNADGASYGYLALRYDLPFQWIPDPLEITIFSGGGIYSAGDGKDLGGPWEFRSGLDVGYRLSERAALGLSYYHLSNAGIYEPNPGSESLHLVFSWRPR